MANFYPRKQTVAVFVLCALIVAGSYWYTNVKSGSIGEGGDKVQALGTEQSAEDQLGQDTLSQVTDWQKQFLAQGTNPTPNNDKSSESEGVVTSELTTTDIMGRSLFARYLELRQNNLSEDDRFVSNVAEETLDETISGVLGPKLYSKDAIIVAPETNTSTIKTYSNTVASILVNDSPRANALEIASDAFEQKDFDMLKNIDPVIVSYRNIVAKLVATPVPQPLSDSHLDLINSMSALLYLTEGLRNVSDDPLPAIVALSAHKDIESLAQNALAKTRGYIVSNGISFEDYEPGKLFLTATLTLQ